MSCIGQESGDFSLEILHSWCKRKSPWSLKHSWALLSPSDQFPPPLNEHCYVGERSLFWKGKASHVAWKSPPQPRLAAPGFVHSAQACAGVSRRQPPSHSQRNTLWRHWLWSVSSRHLFRHWLAIRTIKMLVSRRRKGKMLPVPHKWLPEWQRW